MGDISMLETSAYDPDSSSYEEKLANVNVIAKPIASKKNASKIYKLLKKASKKKKTHLFIGLKAVQAKIRKGETGLVIIAGDVSPIDVMCHMPCVCEEKDIPYIYVPSKMDMGAAVGTRGPVQIALIKNDDEFQEYYDKVLEIIKKSQSESCSLALN